MKKPIRIIVSLSISIFIGLSACSNVTSDSNSESRNDTNVSLDSIEQNTSTKTTNVIKENQSDTDESVDVVENSETNTIEETQGQYNANSFIKNQYKKGNITVNYPQLANADSDEKITMNHVIAKDASNTFEEGSYEGFSGEINYEMPYISDELFSITYHGLMTSKSHPYPTNLFYSTIINVKTGGKVTLGDLITINEEFINKFREGKIISSSSSEHYYALQEYISSLSNEELLNLFSHADASDNSRMASTYITENSIVVTIGVIHALGDFLQVEISKSNLHFK